MTKCLHIYLSYGEGEREQLKRALVGCVGRTPLRTGGLEGLFSHLKRATDLTFVCFPFDMKEPHVRVINSYLINFRLFETQVGIRGIRARDPT